MKIPPLYMAFNGEDYVIARDLDSARRIVHFHDHGTDAPEVFSPAELAQVDKEGWQDCVRDRLFTLYNEDPLEGDSEETYTVTEWVKRIGRPCYFAHVP